MPAETISALEKEIGAWDPGLLVRPRLVVLTKADLVDPAQAASRAAPLGALVVSAVTGAGMADLKERLWNSVARASDVSPLT